MRVARVQRLAAALGPTAKNIDRRAHLLRILLVLGDYDAARLIATPAEIERFPDKAAAA